MKGLGVHLKGKINMSTPGDFFSLRFFRLPYSDAFVPI